MPDFDPLPCSKIVHRTITRARDFVDGRVLTAAFQRRDNDKKGLSVDFDVDVPAGCAPQLTGKRAVVSLHVGRIRNAGLNVLADAETHGNITGIPFYSSYDEREKAEQLAAKLAEQSRVAWPLH